MPLTGNSGRSYVRGMGTDNDLRTAAREVAPRSRRIADIGRDDVSTAGGTGANPGDDVRATIAGAERLIVMSAARQVER